MNEVRKPRRRFPIGRGLSKQLGGAALFLYYQSGAGFAILFSGEVAF